MAFDSAEMLDPQYAIVQEFPVTGDPPDYLYLTQDITWNSGDEPTINYVHKPLPRSHPGNDAFGSMYSAAKRVGKFPLGCIADGEVVPPLVTSVTVAYDADPSASGRGGSLRFAPAATYGNGDPGLRGKLLRSDQLNRSAVFYDIEMLMRENCKMNPWLNPVLFGFGVPTGASSPGPYIDPTVDFSPGPAIRGHIMRLILYRSEQYKELAGP